MNTLISNSNKKMGEDDKESDIGRQYELVRDGLCRDDL